MSDEAKFKVEDKVRLKYVSPDEYFDWVKTAHEEQWIGVITAPAVYPDHTEYMVHFDAEHELTFTVDELEPIPSPRDEQLRSLKAALEPFANAWAQYTEYILNFDHAESEDGLPDDFLTWAVNYWDNDLTADNYEAAYQALHIHSEKG